MSKTKDTEYKIITAGGRENGPLDVDTIRSLFAKNLINKDTLVFVPSLNKWTRLAEVFDVSKWKDKGTPNNVPIVSPSSQSESKSQQQINLVGNAQPDVSGSNKAVGCLLGIVIGFAIIYSAITTLATKQLVIPTPLLWLWILIAAIVGGLATLKFKKRMEKGLRRKVKGNYELTSISSWIEASSKDEKQPVTVSNLDMSSEKTIKKNSSKSDKTSEVKPNKKTVKRIRQINETNKDAAGTDSDFQNPRLHHYLFAHRYLPEELQKNPGGVRMWLTGEKGVGHLNTRWALSHMMYKSKPDDYIEPDGMDRYIHNLSGPTDNCTIVIVQFPPPKRMTEAFYSAIVFWSDNQYRYFTLELTEGKKPDGSSQTVLGEWTD